MSSTVEAKWLKDYASSSTGMCVVTSVFFLIKFTMYVHCSNLDMLSQVAIATMKSSFPNALRNGDLVKKVTAQLASYGYGKSTLLCTSLCCDEVNRPLEKDFQNAFGTRRSASISLYRSFFPPSYM